MSEIVVTYRFPAGTNVGKQAQVIAVGQTAGTWTARHAHLESSFRSHLGEVVAVTDREAKVRFPRANVEGDIGTLLTMIFGKYSMAGPAKVVGLELPDDYGLRPKLGVAGVRKRLGVHRRPLIMAIFKPALGLSAGDHAAILDEVGRAGLDIIKDDEILPDVAGAPVLERARLGVEVIRRIHAETGRTVLYAVNLTGRADQILDRARALVDLGVNAFLLNGLTHGLSVVEALAADPSLDVPLFLHPAFAGALCGAPDHGLSYPVVLGTLAGISGVDAVLHPTHWGNLPFSAEDEAGIRAALKPRGVWPVPSAGVHPGVVPRAIADYGEDVIINAGTAIMDHPGGPGDGVRAFFEALERHQTGGAFDVEAVPEGPLKAALRQFGAKG